MKNMSHWRSAATAAAVAMAFGLAAAPAAAITFNDGERAYLQQDYKKSLRLLTRLAQRGHPKAQYLLGRQYQFGQGTTKNYVRAYYWYSRAEKKGHVEAGLFRHLLVSKRGMTNVEVAQAKKLLTGGGAGTLAAAKKDIPRAAKKPKKAVKAKAPAARKPTRTATKPKSRKSPARALARKPVRAPTHTALRTKRRARKPTPYATAVVPNRARPPRSGWTNPQAYNAQPCTWCRRNDQPRYRNQPRRQQQYFPRQANRGPGYGRYRNRPRFQNVPRYVYRLPPWQRRQWLRQHRWRVMNDPFYRRAWRAYRRYRHQRRHW